MRSLTIIIYQLLNQSNISFNHVNIIKDVKENTPLNPVSMTVKDWYRHLLEKEVTMEVIDDEGRMVPKLSKV